MCLLVYDCQIFSWGLSRLSGLVIFSETASEESTGTVLRMLNACVISCSPRMYVCDVVHATVVLLRLPYACDRFASLADF